MDRATGYEPGACRFESCRGRSSLRHPNGQGTGLRSQGCGFDSRRRGARCARWPSSGSIPRPTTVRFRHLALGHRLTGRPAAFDTANARSNRAARTALDEKAVDSTGRPSRAPSFFPGEGSRWATCFGSRRWWVRLPRPGPARSERSCSARTPTARSRSRAPTCCRRRAPEAYDRSAMKHRQRGASERATFLPGEPAGDGGGPTNRNCRVRSPDPVPTVTRRCAVQPDTQGDRVRLPGGRLQRDASQMVRHRPD